MNRNTNPGDLDSIDHPSNAHPSPTGSLGVSGSDAVPRIPTSSNNRSVLDERASGGSNQFQGQGRVPVESRSSVFYTSSTFNASSSETWDINEELEDYEEPIREESQPRNQFSIMLSVDGNGSAVLAPPNAEDSTRLRVENFFRDLETSFPDINIANPVARNLSVQEVGAILDSLTTTNICPSDCVNAHGKASTCSICFEDWAQGDVLCVLQCHSSHQFHRNCLQSWLHDNPSCPLCRSLIRKQDADGS
ncbi:hypothetical protein PCANC_00964 [Puccinia coronata f. sp. avenae]|nr:hypothetical protein PCASD_25834 [Puccinia coronata f. sp. avenae]PLW21544.1 hypothetical protein PCANC_03986 [Puccinia coronata f. sp. avenae]PLW24342.1 hypothetical protein PCASD_06557 [Puccinia coronata f. sp. avenae]PLW57876.1 hypothetical protein PCANC_00964 [Puccinia coronata f. sp. avenae]